MAKKDDTTLYIVGGIAILGLGGLLLFKDQIMGLIKPQAEVPLGDDTIDDSPEEPPINQPTDKGPKPTPVAYLQGMDYYATRIAEEIDKNDVKEVHRTTKLNIKATVLAHYKSDLKKLIEANSMQLAAGPTSLNEKALKIFATILLKVCRRMNIKLKPEAKARFEKQAAGKFTLSQALQAITIS